VTEIIAGSVVVGKYTQSPWRGEMEAELRSPIVCGVSVATIGAKALCP
jgi:hypothetical protein